MKTTGVPIKIIIPALAFCLTATLLAADLRLVLEDDLTSADPVGLELAKDVRGGVFSAKGWQAKGSSDQIRIQLPATLYPGDSSGAIEVDISNFDPINQYNSNKHQFINMYSRPDGSKADWLNESKNWWNIRGGTNYMKGGGAGFKVLYAWKGVENRHEHRLIEKTKDWDKTKTYTFRVEWDDQHLDLYLDGKPLRTNMHWSDRVEPSQYIFLGKDNTYAGMKTADGIVYESIRLYALGVDPVGNPPRIDLLEGPTGPITAKQVSIMVRASDPEGDPLTYTWSLESGPDGMEPTIGTGTDPVMAFNQAGDYQFKVIVDDGNGNSVVGFVDVTVNQVASGLNLIP